MDKETLIKIGLYFLASIVVLAVIVILKYFIPESYNDAFLYGLAIYVFYNDLVKEILN
jgi:hypothetical protein